MRFSLHCFRWLWIVAACGSVVDAAVIHKVDDSTVTGDLQSIKGNQLQITGKTMPISVALEEIAQITLKDPPPPPAVPVEPAVASTVDSGPDVGGALLGALFGPSHPQSHAAVATKPVASTAASSRPVAASSIKGQFQLTDGDMFHAMLLAWSDQKLSFKLAGDSLLDCPSNAVSEVWLGSADLQTKARKLTVEPGPEDIAFVTRDNDVVVVKGLVQGISGDSLQFRYGDQDRKIGLSKVVGLLLRSNAPAPLGSFHQLVHTDNGDQFSGSLAAVDHDSLTVLLPSGARPRLPLAAITHIDFLNGRVTFLTDLKPTKVEQTAYFGRLIPYRINQSLNGGPLMLADGPCSNGIAVHSKCALQYDVSSGFDRFKTRLGFEQPGGQTGRVDAQVLADGKPIYHNPDARGDHPPIEIDVPLANVRQLTLLIDFGADQDVGDRVVWANPRLLRQK